MSLEGKKIIKIGGNELIDYPTTADFTTDAIEFRIDHMWSLQVSFTGTVTGNPKLTIECSNTQTDWLNYRSQSTNVDLTNVDNRLLFDESFPPRYMRLKYVANGNIDKYYKL